MVVALDGVTIARSSVFGTEKQTRFAVVARPPGPSAGTSAGSGEGSSPDDAAMGDVDVDVDVDVDDSFSAFAPERLSGIIDLLLVSMVNDKRVEVIEEDGPPSNSSQTWVEILNGNFEHGLGIFHASVSADTFDHVAY